MSGQWQHSTRAQRLPADWHARRAACYRRAGGRCQWMTDGHRCTSVAPLHKRAGIEAGHADHIDRQGDDDQLQWLCPPHHRAKTTREGADALRAMHAKGRRAAEQHPGLS